MGARVFFNIKQSNDLYISLYSHWGEYDRFTDLARALKASRPRWDDESYCARIIVSQLIGKDWDSSLGFGLIVSTVPMTDETSIEIDLVNQVVIDETGTHDFDSFIKYHSVDKKESAVV